MGFLRRRRRAASDRDGLVADVVREQVGGPVTASGERRIEDALLAHLPAGVAVIRMADGEIVLVNATWERMFGYDPGELVGRHISVVNAPSAVTPQQRAEEILGGLERDGTWMGEIENIRRDGTRFWTSAAMTCFDDPTHGTLCVTVQSDATARRAAELSRSEADERLRAVFEDSPTGMALFGTDLRVIDVNACLCAVTGYTRDELIGTPFADLTHPDDLAREAELAARLRAGEIPRYRVQLRYITKDGRAVPVVVIATAVHGPDGRPRFGLAVVDAQPPA